MGWLRRLPGPVWTLMLWMFVATIDDILLVSGASSNASQRAWAPHAAFNGIAFLLLLILRDRTPAWLLVSIVLVETLEVGRIVGGSDQAVEMILAALGLIMAVLYIGLWWHGWIPPAYTGLAAVVLLIAFHQSGKIEEWRMVWFVLASVMFGMTLGLQLTVGRLNRVAKQDALTGMLNTIGLEEYDRLHRRAGRALTPRVVVAIDLDGFKKVNDTQGHVAGDRLLHELGSAWLGALRPDDVGARIGGDEFLLILPQTDEHGAELLLERLRAVSPIPWSSGVTTWHTDEALETARVRADHLMYQDKRVRGQVHPPREPSRSVARTLDARSIRS